MIETWIVIGFVIAVPLFSYVGFLALFNRMLKNEKPIAQVVMLNSKQPTQCQVSKNGQDS